jgi:hypothetical protein
VRYIAMPPFVKSDDVSKNDISIFELTDKYASFYKDNTEIFKVTMDENPAIRAYSDGTDYLFSIEKNDSEEVLLKYKNQTVITLNESGAKMGNESSSIDQQSYFESAYDEENYIGCNIVIN